MLEIFTWSELDENARAALLTRPALAADAGLTADVETIVQSVRRNGDDALKEFSRNFDGVEPAALRVAPEQLAAAWSCLSLTERQALRHARKNIETFHLDQRVEFAPVTVEPGVVCRQERRPIDAVGLYVPGGSAPLPSAVLMLAVPAAVSGCARVALCSPPQADGEVATSVLATAHLCGVVEVYRVGGAQAIAALAYGTETIAPVRKIFGPGNAWVTAAKLMVAQDPAGAICDLPAGPSEVLVIADGDADAAVVASDLLAQAEHGPDSQALLFTDSASLAARAADAIAAQTPQRSRSAIIRQALSGSAIVVFADIDEALAVSNRYAPEHLIINTRDAREKVAQVQNAGAVFVGPWAAETFGDYCSGTNHVLPTYGYAAATSGLTVSDFEKAISVQEIDAAGFDALADTAATLARMEGLDAHAAAVEERRRLRSRRGAA